MTRQTMKVTKGQRRPPADGSWRVVAPRAVPLYVARHLEPRTAVALEAWALSQGFGTTLGWDALHATVCYSRRPVDLARVDPAPPYVRVPHGGPRAVEALGSGGAVVLRFESDELELRWKEFLYAGAEWDYARFRPHVTITYGGAGVDLALVEPFSGELLFGPERFEEIREEFVRPVEKVFTLPLAIRRAATILVAKARRRGSRGRGIQRPRSFLRADLAAARELELAARLLEPHVARAFTAAARAMRDAASVRAMTAAIERGDFEEAIRLAQVDTLPDRLRGSGLEPGAPSAVDELVDAFREGGAAGMRQMPRAAALAASLDLTNPESVRYLRTTVPSLITRISDESREAVRQALERGFREGRPARLIAEEIKGAIGLTPGQQNAAANFRRQLETGEMGSGAAPWARRLSAAERSQARAIFEGTVTGGRTKIGALVTRYEESLLNRRARDIARTEVTRAHGAGQAELWRQAEEGGLLQPARTRRVWVVTPDDRLRDEHAVIPDMNPDGVGLNEPFDTPIGPVMAPRESGDPSFDVNCFPAGVLVSGTFVGGLEARYSGEMIELVTAGGVRLSVTPNHPVLTTTGLTAAGDVHEGEYLITDRSQVSRRPAGTVEEQNGPASVEQVLEALAVSGGRRTLPVTALDLDGDEAALEDEVGQVGADGCLRGDYFSGVREQLQEVPLVAADVVKRLAPGPRALDSGLESVLRTSPRGPGGRTLTRDFSARHLRPLKPFGFGAAADRDTLLAQYARDRVARDPELVGKMLERGAGLITFDEVIEVHRREFSGHVYHPESVNGWIVANTVITSNCRCTVALEFLD